jgi:general secretion pathway protein M
MQLVSDTGNSKLTALLLLVIALILVYLLGFHWFILRHLEYASDLDGLQEQLGRFEAVAAQRDPMEAQLKDIREGRQDANLFLDEADFNEAAAAMSNRLNNMVSTLAEDDCQIVSRQPVRPRAQERYERVTVNVRMRCQSDDLLRILYRLESAVPMVIVDDLNIVRPRVRRTRRDSNDVVSAPLDIRFNMSGYIR